MSNTGRDYGSETQERTATVLLQRLARYMKPYVGLVVLILVLTAIFAGGRFGRAYLMKPLIDEVLLPAQFSQATGEAIPGAADPRSAAADAVRDAVTDAPPAPEVETARREALEGHLGASGTFKRILLAAFVIVTVMPIALFFRAYLSNWVLGSVQIDMQREIAGKLLRVPLSFHRSGTSGDLLSRSINDAAAAHTTLRVVMIDLAIAGVMLAMGAVTLIAISWQLSVISFLSAPVIVGVLLFFTGKVRRGARRRQEQMGEVVQRLTSILSGIKVIKAFRGEALETEAFAEETRKLFRRSMKVVRNKVAGRSLVDMINNTTGIAMLILGAWLVIHGYWGLTTGDIAVFATVLATTYKPMKSLSRGWAQVTDSLASVERYFEVIDVAEEPADVPDAVQIDGVHEGIRFDHISFSYGETAILRDVSLDVKRGEVMAIVGPTGGGKTTFVDLLLRFHDVETGAIEIDGTDLRNIARRSLLAQTAVVSQEPFLFDTTIWENIRYGRPEASDEEIEAAARAAHVDEFVEQLPDGYATRVGEFGLSLSGGQRQRITIARAVLKRPAILVFDEATSALDAKTERTVQEAINALRGQQTIFIVAHRLSTIRAADRIVVLESGRVSQLGTHDELMAHEGGLYHELVSLQVESDT